MKKRRACLEPVERRIEGLDEGFIPSKVERGQSRGNRIEGVTRFLANPFFLARVDFALNWVPDARCCKYLSKKVYMIRKPTRSTFLRN